jgi:hypothetical protein
MHNDTGAAAPVTTGASHRRIQRRHALVVLHIDIGIVGDQILDHIVIAE